MVEALNDLTPLLTSGNTAEMAVNDNAVTHEMTPDTEIEQA